MGLANFYRRFIPEFAAMAKPLTDLTKKDVSFHWGVLQNEVFNKMKDLFTLSPVLVFPDLQLPL